MKKVFFLFLLLISIFNLKSQTWQEYSDSIYKIMQSDKKNTEGKINLVLLKKIGQAYFERGLDKEKIKKLLN